MATHLHYSEVPPLKEFISLIEESSLELQKAQNFLIRVTENPLLLFKEASIYLKSNRNIVTAVMSTSYLKDDKVNGHAFQVFLASILNEALQTWTKENHISYNVKVLVRNPNSFPSIFVVYVNDQEVVQFNIFEKWYGIRERIFLDSQIEESTEKLINSYKEEIVETENRIEKWRKFKKNPFYLIRTPRDVYSLLFKRKKLNLIIEKKLTSLEETKERIQNDIQLTKEGLPQLISLNQTKKEYITCITPFFKQISYSLEKEKYNLY